MKYLLLFLSIFCSAYICNAQKPGKYNFMLCDAAPGKISQVKLQEIINSDCKFLNLHDELGNEIEILNFTFALTLTNKNAYFEMVNGSKITEEIKKRLTKASAGDMFVIANVACMINGEKKLLDGVAFNITE